MTDCHFALLFAGTAELISEIYSGKSILKKIHYVDVWGSKDQPGGWFGVKLLDLPAYIHCPKKTDRGS